MARVVVRVNNLTQAEVEALPGVKAAQAQSALRVAELARELAPSSTGHYRRSIKTDGKTVYSTDIAAHLIEWGSIRNQPYAPLRRAARAAGLRVEADSK